ncbi:CHAT domain-containing protein [Phenylobacterium sp.]|uniref:CHAT domain-containing protein n=1 Tax=Phenylobacterium sp. TaxID=1871053 RepID=UPI0025CEF25A|nr:CHAT domain-containing protein [Phenylobacterium sp.]MBX3483850.1 CHAT domain-containing protein [Phenylobacterium sp.]
MALGFPSGLRLRSLAGLGVAASLFLGGVAPARAATPDAQIGAAARLFFDGQGLKARAQLIALAEAARDDPAARARALASLLEICRRMRANACLAEHAQAYVDAVVPSPDPAQRLRRALEVDYHVNATRLAIGSKAALDEALADRLWAADTPATGVAWLRRRALRAEILRAAGSREEAERAAGEVLAIVGALEAPEPAAYEVATVLADVLAILVELGAYERAHGLYAASAAFITAALPARTPEALLLHRTAADLLEAVDDGEGAARETDAVLAGLATLELDPDTRDRVRGWALGMKAALCRDAPDCGLRALADHPMAALYRTPGRAPAGLDEVAYLAARAVAAQRARTPDAVAAQALGGPLGFEPDAAEAAAVDAYRLAGAALARQPGPEKAAALVRLGGRVRAAASAINGGPAGSWYRPGVLDRLLIGLSLIPAARQGGDPETTFALVQLAGRAGPGFDADAMTLLASARDPALRRLAHDGLRLRARRDRQEQASIAEMIRRGGSAGAAGGAPRPFTYDAGRLAELGGLNARLAASDAALAKAGLATSGANLVTLQKLRGVLAADEAALAYVPVGGELLYACVRREGMTLVTARPDTSRVSLDARLIEAALSATHAPDEAADSQFPVAAAVRLYDVFLRPFEPCLKRGDRVTWLSPLVSVGGLPLAALLPREPPRRGEGWDLAAAEWFVRAHAVSYAGSASALVAARTARSRPPDRDFLGVGDPVLDGPAAAAVRKAGLGPLPETATELAASARPFRTAQVLTGAEATEARVREALAPGARLVSFATHGVMRGEVEGVDEPALVLTPGEGGDGFLTASEIADLQLPADFVALSACNTANLEFTRLAQDLPALSSAFAQAGVRGVMGTLWPVNSETGATVVSGLFARLAGPDAAGPAAALAEAQRAYLAAPPGRAQLHPRFWAPFIILGDGGR